MKKILFMVSSMNVGGVEKSLISLLSIIPKEKYEITLLLLEKKGDFLKQIPRWIRVEEVSWFKNFKSIFMQPPKQTIIEYFINKEYKRIPTFIYSYFLSKKLDDRFIYYKEVFKSIPDNLNFYDVAIAYQGPTDIIDFYIANKVNAKKKISWVHFDISKHSINQKLYHKLFRKFDKVFVVSEEAKRRLIDKLPKCKQKVEVFLNIVSVDLVNEMSKEKVEFDQEYEGTKIVTVGRLSSEKGQDIAIKVLFKLLKNGYNVRWYCIGDGKEKEEYEILIDKFGLKDDFILLGSKNNPYPYILNADIYVQTSRHEGYCLTLAEAKCLYKPIVTTNFIGAYEQIVDGFNGFIVSQDEKEVYNKIKFLIDNPKIRKDLVNNLSETNVDTTNEITKFYDYIS